MISTMAWSLLIVDDHPDFRRAARELLTSDAFEVVGEAADAAEAVALATRLEPSLVLLDVRLPDRDGFSVAESLAGMAVPPAVVLTSSHDVTMFRDRLAGAPVRGFVAKADLSVDTLADLVGEP
jgi:DNA-binding NarL/FixJ family response regulator